MFNHNAAAKSGGYSTRDIEIDVAVHLVYSTLSVLGGA